MAIENRWYKSNGQPNGNSLQVRDPDRYGQIVALLADGMSWGKVAKETKSDWHTVARIYHQQGGAVEEWKAKAAAKAEVGAEMALERIYEKLDSDEAMSRERVKDVALTYAILKDKEILLKGEATSRTENVNGLSIEAAKKAIEEARKRIDAEVVEV